MVFKLYYKVVKHSVTFTFSMIPSKSVSSHSSTMNNSSGSEASPRTVSLPRLKSKLIITVYTMVGAAIAQWCKWTP